MYTQGRTRGSRNIIKRKNQQLRDLNYILRLVFIVINHIEFSAESIINYRFVFTDRYLAIQINVFRTK